MDGIAGHSKLAPEWAEKFGAQNSGVKVNVQFIANGEEAVKQFLIQSAAGNPPDVFTYFQETIPITAAVEKNLLYPLDDLVKGENHDLSDFLPQALQLNVWDGKMYAIPRDYGNQQIYYNVDMFKKEGLRCRRRTGRTRPGRTTGTSSRPRRSRRRAVGSRSSSAC